MHESLIKKTGLQRRQKYTVDELAEVDQSVDVSEEQELAAIRQSM